MADFDGLLDAYDDLEFEKHLKHINKYAKKLGVSTQYFEEEFLLEGQLPDLDHYLRFKTETK